MEAASPVLRKMLSDGMKETNQREVLLKGVNVKAWKAVLDYIYTARMELPSAEEAVEYLACAKRFRVEELEKAISDYIEQELDTFNCCEILAQADGLNSTKLRGAAMRTIVRNFHEVLYEEGFQLLPFQLVREIFSCNKLVVRSELDVFVAIVRWLMRRVKCNVTEELKGETEKRANDVLARRVLSLFVEYELVEPILTESNPLFFGTSRLADSHTVEHFNFHELFDCVDINNLSVDDLRRVSGLFRKADKAAGTNGNIDMTHVRKFSEKAVEKLVELHNSVPNIPVALYERVSHGWNDVLATFSHRFHGVQTLRGERRPIGYQQSPEFTERFSMGKWSVRVYFRGCNEEVRDKYASCFLYRTAEPAGTGERTTFASQIFMDLGNSSDKSRRKVYSHPSALDDTQRYGDGQGWGSVNCAPTSAFWGKNTVTVGVMFYFKASDI